MYSIGEFAKRVGINAQTIRYYEQLGILPSNKDANNNYRKYSDLNVRKLLCVRLYKSLGFPLNDIKQFVQSSSLESIQENLSNRVASLEEEIEALQAIQRQAVFYVQGCTEAREKQGQIWMEQQNSRFYRLRQTSKNALLPNKNRELHTTMLMNMPRSSMSVCIQRESLLTESVPLSYDWGLRIDEGDLRDAALQAKLEYCEAPSFCAVTILALHDGEELCKQHFAPLLAYLKEQRVLLKGDILGRLLLPEYNGKPTNYIKFFAPV